jgi:hypothetical protein
MPNDVRQFLVELDTALAAEFPASTHLDLHLVGRSALILRYGVPVATADFDVLDTTDRALLDRALALFGRGTPAAERAGLFLERVPQGLPPVPNRFKPRCTLVPGNWSVVRPWFLEPNDYAATKLNRFAQKDREDLQYLCDHGLIEPVELRRSLESAFLWTAEKDGDPIRDRAFENLARVIAYLDGRAPTL